MTVSRMLRVEGLVLLLGALAMYALLGGSWVLFVVLLIVPDLSLLAYRVSAQAGATAYNVVHLYLLPVVLFAVGYALSAPLAMQIAAIWLAHIGMDRTLGLGLRYATEAKVTHIQRA